MGIQDMLVSDKIRVEIEPHLIQLRQEGWCVLEGVIPESEIDAVREYVAASSEKALEAYTNDWISIIAGVPDFAALPWRRAGVVGLPRRCSITRTCESLKPS